MSCRKYVGISRSPAAAYDLRSFRKSEGKSIWISKMLCDYVVGRNAKYEAKIVCFLAFLVIYGVFILSVFRFSEVSLGRYYGRDQQRRRVENGVASDKVCGYEKTDLVQKKYTNDAEMIKMKLGLYEEIRDFQSKNLKPETLSELMSMKSNFDLSNSEIPKVKIILNHFKRKTLCAQLDSLLHQTLPFHTLWVLSFASPNEEHLRTVVSDYNDSRISFISSGYDFKYYGRFQMALQTEGIDFVYILDDDMIPGKKMLEILCHVAGTEKYKHAIFGSIGRILPFMSKDGLSFPSYQKSHTKEAGLYLPDPAYDIRVERIFEVDFLSSSWFLSAELINTIFIEIPFTFRTGEDLHLSYQLQKYRGISSYVLPVDQNDKDTWGDSDHRLAYISETTSIFKDIVSLRDRQWWRALTSGYVTQWAKMNPQKIDVLFYAHSLQHVRTLKPLFEKFDTSKGKIAHMVISGGRFCPCEDVAKVMYWNVSVCLDRRFKVLDLRVSSSGVSTFNEIYGGMKGLVEIFNPSLVIGVDDLDVDVKNGIELGIERSRNGRSVLVLLPKSVVSKVQWMGDLDSNILPSWKKMQVTISIITQNRVRSLSRLLNSLENAYYMGDNIPIIFNMDSQVDEPTLKLVTTFNWAHGTKTIRKRVLRGGLIKSVSESWYPSSNHDFGLLLEDDIEVSPYYYLWIKYALLTYHYDPKASFPELSSISLYTPRVIEVLRERPFWNPTEFFEDADRNMPYLHQLPCSWGAVFFPKHWREFNAYINLRSDRNSTGDQVEIPRSVTNGWKRSWKKFFIEMMYLRGYVSLYPNFPNQTSFSTNHMEPGVHIQAKNNAVNEKRKDYVVPLMGRDFRELLPHGKLPIVSSLPCLNLYNELASLKDMKIAGSNLGQDVLRCNNGKEIVVVDTEIGLPLKCATF